MAAMRSRQALAHGTKRGSSSASHGEGRGSAVGRQEPLAQAAMNDRDGWIPALRPAALRRRVCADSSRSSDDDHWAGVDPAPSITTSPADGRVWPLSEHSHCITGQSQRVEIISAKEPRRCRSDEEARRLGTAVLGRINGHPASRLDEFLPWNWKGWAARLVT
jgi:hypothetical protein